MQLRTRTWLVICVLSLVGAAVFWRLGEQRLSVRLAGPKPAAAGQPAATPVAPPSTSAVPTAASVPDGNPVAGATTVTSTNRIPATDRASLRLRNTARSADELAHDDRALLLRNALIDTATGTELVVPAHLRAGPEAGSYIIQARGAVSDNCGLPLPRPGPRSFPIFPITPISFRPRRRSPRYWLMTRPCIWSCPSSRTSSSSPPCWPRR